MCWTNNLKAKTQEYPSQNCSDTSANEDLECLAWVQQQARNKTQMRTQVLRPDWAMKGNDRP